MSTATATSDEEILIALTTDFDRGFTAMVHTLQPGIYSGARRFTHNHQDAEEIAQDTFLRAYKALANIRRRADQQPPTTSMGVDHRSQLVPHQGKTANTRPH